MPSGDISGFLLAAEEAKPLQIAWGHHVDGYGSLCCWLYSTSSSGSVGIYSWKEGEAGASHRLTSGVMWPPDYFSSVFLGANHIVQPLHNPKWSV